MQTLYALHSYGRWLVVALVLISIVKLSLVWLRGASWGGADRGIFGATMGMIDLQMLLGLILLFSPLATVETRYRMEHATTMLIAVVVAHLSAIWKRREGPLRARNTVIMLLLAALLIVAGVMRLPGGWMRGLS
jgi:hypothetical protein